MADSTHNMFLTAGFSEISADLKPKKHALLKFCGINTDLTAGSSIHLCGQVGVRARVGTGRVGLAY